jgi:hypothetical protein
LSSTAARQLTNNGLGSLTATIACGALNNHLNNSQDHSWTKAGANQTIRSGPSHGGNLMRKKILATATALTLAAGLTSSAMAFDRNADSGPHTRHFRAGASGGMYGSRSRHLSRFAGVRGFESRRYSGSAYYESGPSYRGGFVDLGPLGITTACGYCGSGYGTPIDAWSR